MRRSRRQALAIGAGLATVWLVLRRSAAAGSADEPPASPPSLDSLFGGPFDLIDHQGRRRSDRDFLGRYLLVYFGYTYCPDICPTNLATMAAAIDALGELGKKLQPLFISIDPERDSVAVLADYVPHFHERLVGLTGGEAAVAAAARAYRIHRRKVILEGNGDYLVDHASITHLIGPDGRFLTLFPHDTPAERMTEVLRKYLR